MNLSTDRKPGLFRKFARPFIAGLLAAFPLAFTAVFIFWLARSIHNLLGPYSTIGKLLRSIGLKFVTSDFVAYLIGLCGALALIYFLGILVEAGMKKRWNALIDRIMNRVPLVNKIYDAAKKLIKLFDEKDQAEMKAMSPVMCYFGGDGGTAVLALMPSQEKIRLQNVDYHVVMIPSAPVPFGGALMYVPAEWVTPVDFAFDGLFNVYMSMGVTSSDYLVPKQSQNNES